MTAADDWSDLFSEWGNDVNGSPLACSVKTFTGSGQLGPSYAAPTSKPGLPQFPQQRLVRTAQGNEIVSSSALYAPLTDRAVFTLHSLVTLANGREAVVLAVAEADIEGLFGFLRIDLE